MTKILLFLLIFAANLVLSAACLRKSTSDLLQAEAQADACGGKKILIVTSSSGVLTLKDGSQYPSGVFLREITDPVLALKQAGCQFELATPTGEAPVIDSNSLELLWTYYPYPQLQPHATAIRDQAVALAEDLYGPLQFSRETPAFDRISDEVKRYIEVVNYRAQERNLRAKPVKALTEIVDELSTSATNESPYAGIFIPGGHVPLEDLIADANLGTILNHFHDRGLPTGLICHGPIALKSAQRGGRNTYRGYKITAIEGQGEALLELAGPLRGYEVSVYVDDVLRDEGLKVLQNPWPGYPLVVRDRELVTAQNPASGPFVGRAFVAMLRGQTVPHLITDDRMDSMTRQSDLARKVVELARSSSNAAAVASRSLTSLMGFEFPALSGETNIFLDPRYVRMFDKSMTHVHSFAEPESNQLMRYQLPFFDVRLTLNPLDVFEPKYNYFYRFPDNYYGFGASGRWRTQDPFDCNTIPPEDELLDWLTRQQDQTTLTAVFDCMAPSSTPPVPTGLGVGYGSLYAHWPLWNQLQSQVGELIWGGKRFYRRDDGDGVTLVNKMRDAGTERYRANVYATQSTRQGESIVLDYRVDRSVEEFGPPATSVQRLVDQISVGIRDEIREVKVNGRGTKIYIGRAHLSRSVIMAMVTRQEVQPPNQIRFDSPDEWVFAANFFLDFR